MIYNDKLYHMAPYTHARVARRKMVNGGKSDFTVFTVFTVFHLPVKTVELNYGKFTGKSFTGNL